MILNLIISAIILWVTFRLCDWAWRKWKAKKECQKAPEIPKAVIRQEELDDGKIKETYTKDGNRIEVIRKVGERGSDQQVMFQKPPNLVQHYEFH